MRNAVSILLLLAAACTGSGGLKSDSGKTPDGVTGFGLPEGAEEAATLITPDFMRDMVANLTDARLEAIDAIK